MPSIPISAFISHASKEKEIAGALKDALEVYLIEGFVAHDDIIGGEEWLTSLMQEIEACDVFIALLSSEFHKAAFTDHEVGIAYALEKPIIPISMDNTIPYGFISKYQSVKAKEGITSEFAETMAHTIYLKISSEKGQALDAMIEGFGKVGSWDQANKMASLLFTYEELFSKHHVNAIAEAFLENDQVRGGYRAKRYASQLFEEREEELAPETKQRLAKFLK